MTIGLNEIKDHVGHDIVCVRYGSGECYAIECETCSMVLFEYDLDSEIERRTLALESIYTDSANNSNRKKGKKNND